MIPALMIHSRLSLQRKMRQASATLAGAKDDYGQSLARSIKGRRAFLIFAVVSRLRYHRLLVG